MEKLLPSSMADYLDGIRKVMPLGCISPDLEELKIFKFKDAYPVKGESLCSWIDTAARNAKGKLPLTMILGESRSDYRLPRQPSGEDASGDEPWLTMACTCDGAGGARAVFGLLRDSHLSLDKVDFDALVDEWSLVPQRVKESHLIILGTPEVNIFGTFLHGLVKDFHYGQKVWPPDLSSVGDKLVVAGHTYLRSPGGGKVNDCGGVFLLKNPWNPDYRVLWIGGLTGRATWHGCLLVASGWDGYIQHASMSIGVFFGRRQVAGGGRKVEPCDWLLWSEGEPTWQSGLKPQLGKSPIKHKPKKHVFLSYCHDNVVAVGRLRDALITEGEVVWWDEDILPGRNWKQEIRRAMKKSYAVVLCLSKELVDRVESGVYPEILDAVAAFRQQAPGSIFLIPVRLSNCRIPDIEIDDTRTIEDLEYVDLFPASKRKDGLKRLLQALRATPGHL